MAGKVVCIKIGYSVTQVAEMDQDTRNLRIRQSFLFETPEQVIDEEGVHVTDEFVEKIKSGMAENGITSTRVIFTIFSNRVANRDITLPLVREKKIQPMLIANSKEYFPVDLTKYQLVYRVISTDKTKKQMELSVFAVPNTIVESYQALAKALQLQLVDLDYYGNSVYQAMMHGMSQELSATLCIEDNSSMITVIQNGRTVLQRSIGYGIDEAVETLRRSAIMNQGTTYLQALQTMQKNTCFHSLLKGESEGESISMNPRGESAKDSVTKSLTMLIGNVSRVLDYFTSRHSDIELKEISLVGLGAACLGLDQLLGNELGIPVKVPGKASGWGSTGDVYYALMGATIKPLKFVLEKEEKKKTSEDGESLRTPVLVASLCAGVAVILCVAGLLMNVFTAASNRSMKKQIEDKKDVITVYNEYIQSKALYDGLTKMGDMTKEPNSDFLNFLRQMEEKMPSDLLVSKLTASAQGITMSVETKTKESAAEAIMQLRTFDCLGVIDCSEVKENINDSGEKSELFDITVTYDNTSETETQEQPAEQETTQE